MQVHFIGQLNEPPIQRPFYWSVVTHSFRVSAAFRHFRFLRKKYENESGEKKLSQPPFLIVHENHMLIQS
jgi:hypothetical protein